MTPLLAARAPASGTADAPGLRYGWLDAAKGLSIILVVFGHVFPPPLGTSIAVVRMPFFFFLAGYLFKARPWPDFLWRRGNSLLVPYVVYLLAIVAIARLISRWTGPIDWFVVQPPLALLRDMVKGGSHLDGYAGPLWFLTTLFATLALYNLVRLAAARRGATRPTDPPVIIAVGALLALGYALQARQTYLGLGIAPVALFFVWAGSAFRTITPPSWLIWPAATILVAAVAQGLAAWPHGQFDMRRATYGIPVLSLLGSIAGCYVLVTACRFLARNRRIEAALASFGRNSIVIMSLHLVIAIPLGRFLHLPVIFTFIAAVLIPYLIARGLGRGHWTLRWVFLGQPPPQPAWLRRHLAPAPAADPVKSA